VVVADGAGGLAGGARAAERLVALVQEAAGATGFAARRPEAWAEVLARADLAVEADPAAGETTAVAVAVAGDSLGWRELRGLRHLGRPTEGGVDDLTAQQRRKPRLGSGGARPISFTRPGLTGTLLVATDGLFNYALPENIAAAAIGEDLDAAARALVQLVRLAGGGLQDDVGVVLVRAGPR
jgi:serine/threonine protein phosphatase PrpC